MPCITQTGALPDAGRSGVQCQIVVSKRCMSLNRRLPSQPPKMTTLRSSVVAIIPGWPLAQGGLPCRLPAGAQRKVERLRTPAESSAAVPAVPCVALLGHAFDAGMEHVIRAAAPDRQCSSRQRRRACQLRQRQHNCCVAWEVVLLSQVAPRQQPRRLLRLCPGTRHRSGAGQPRLCHLRIGAGLLGRQSCWAICDKQASTVRMPKLRTAF